MTAAEKAHALYERIARAGGIDVQRNLTMLHCGTLRRAQLTLHRWAEMCCGWSTTRASMVVVRDEDTGKPFREVHPHNMPTRRYPIPDREAGALRRVEQVCKDCGLHYYHNTDPRGCALWVATFPLDQSNYNQGIACL